MKFKRNNEKFIGRVASWSFHVNHNFRLFFKSVKFIQFMIKLLSKFRCLNLIFIIFVFFCKLLVVNKVWMFPVLQDKLYHGPKLCNYRPLKLLHKFWNVASLYWIQKTIVEILFAWASNMQINVGVSKRVKSTNEVIPGGLSSASMFRLRLHFSDYSFRWQLFCLFSEENVPFSLSCKITWSKKKVFDRKKIPHPLQ